MVLIAILVNNKSHIKENNTTYEMMLTHTKWKHEVKQTWLIITNFQMVFITAKVAGTNRTAMVSFFKMDWAPAATDLPINLGNLVLREEVDSVTGVPYWSISPTQQDCQDLDLSTTYLLWFDLSLHTRGASHRLHQPCGRDKCNPNPRGTMIVISASSETNSGFPVTQLCIGCPLRGRVTGRN